MPTVTGEISWNIVKSAKLSPTEPATLSQVTEKSKAVASLRSLNLPVIAKVP
jgi:hypothetical protein